MQNVYIDFTFVNTYISLVSNHITSVYTVCWMFTSISNLSTPIIYLSATISHLSTPIAEILYRFHIRLHQLQKYYIYFTSVDTDCRNITSISHPSISIIRLPSTISHSSMTISLLLIWIIHPSVILKTKCIASTTQMVTLKSKCITSTTQMVTLKSKQVISSSHQ